MEYLGKTWILEKLAFLGIDLTPLTLQIYVREELIPAPTFPSKGQGARGLYSSETPAEAYAAYRLIRENRRSHQLVREARRIGRYLENTNYHSLGDIFQDIEIRKLIHKRPKEVFYAFEWLWLKYQVLPEKELPVGPAIRGILIGLAETGDDYIKALLGREYKEDV